MNFNWKSHWNAMASKDVYDQVNRSPESVQADTQYVVDSLKLSREHSVVDFCCGNGLITCQVAEMTGSTLGVDQSAAQLESAARISQTQELANCSFLSRSVADTDIEENTFDAAYCLTSFHYFPDMEYAKRVISEMTRIVKPGGRILITDVPDEGSLWHLIWKFLRNPDLSAKPELIEMQPSQSAFPRMLHRIKLLTRRWTGKKVESDNWTWFSQHFFENIYEGSVMGTAHCIKSRSTNRYFNYRFDVIIHIGKLQ